MNAEERKRKVGEVIIYTLRIDKYEMSSKVDQAAQAIDEYYQADKKAEVEKAITQTPSHYFDSPYEAYIEVSAIRKSLLGEE